MVLEIPSLFRRSYLLLCGRGIDYPAVGGPPGLRHPRYSYFCAVSVVRDVHFLSGPSRRWIADETQNVPTATSENIVCDDLYPKS
jgi:hypothetical protein